MKKKLIISIKRVSIIILLLILYLYLNKTIGFEVPCIFHKITKLHCPGCGLTRMIVSILKLNFYQAFRYNPFLFILMPFFIVYGIIYYINWLNNKKTIMPNLIWYILLIAAIIFMILRNIPYFSYLAPTII